MRQNGRGSRVPSEVDRLSRRQRRVAAEASAPIKRYARVDMDRQVGMTVMVSGFISYISMYRYLCIYSQPFSSLCSVGWGLGVGEEIYFPSLFSLTTVQTSA